MTMEFLDVPGWLYEGEGIRLGDMAAGKAVLEIGCFCGRSTMAMAPHAKHVTCVDWMQGTTTDQLGQCDPIKLRTKFEHNTRAYADKITLYETTFNDFASNPQNNPNNWGFIFHDAGHSYKDLKEFWDWIEGWNYEGSIAVHDYGKPDFPGTEKACNEFLRGCKDYTVRGSLLCLTKKSVASVLRSIDQNT